MDLLAARLEQLGFTVWRLPFGTTPNLFARRGTGAPHFCFAGHTDVVPPGSGAWRADPFGGEVQDDQLVGRGACDMKGAIAAFVAAVADAPVNAPVNAPGDARGANGSVSLLITGDEEGPARDGTVRVLEWMQREGHVPDFCVVGEPTNRERLGDVIKIGRRGSLNVTLTVDGVQGHSAYPQRADNPVHRLVRILAGLTAEPLDAGSGWFEPSTLQVTSVDVGNPATNIIPARAVARFNIRFNDHHTGASLQERLRAAAGREAERFELTFDTGGGDSFVTPPGPMLDRLRAAVAAACGTEPALDTGGGTSDARFIARVCPVAEFGLVGTTMHQVDERVPVADLRALAGVYRAVLAAFARMGA